MSKRIGVVIVDFLHLVFEITKLVVPGVLLFGVVPYGLYRLTGFPIWATLVIMLFLILCLITWYIIVTVSAIFKALSHVDAIPYDDLEYEP